MLKESVHAELALLHGLQQAFKIGRDVWGTHGQRCCVVHHAPFGRGDNDFLASFLDLIGIVALKQVVDHLGPCRWGADAGFRNHAFDALIKHIFVRLLHGAKQRCVIEAWQRLGLAILTLGLQHHASVASGHRWQSWLSILIIIRLALDLEEHLPALIHRHHA